ncbi:hypothetical protein DLEV_027 [Diachasmimorpha longicaudata entomopoxvirus]|uniref:Uncharacterized protein n=1 Tax=Diachasmimorpha longicaudata entomopoxvirus TaxID=109981 RepID=A0A7R5WRT6_9POXV|nr:hypothetical protein QKK69_gp027 [Diachasmimorpha longicaudata entomopoxvirus]AKS26318.1 hypothetical protein DLEV_027 [Diachasmimorpha longicaudata entomopoxvirus]
MYFLFLHLTPSQIKALETEHAVSINKKTTAGPFNYYLTVSDPKILQKIQKVLDGTTVTYKYKDNVNMPKILPSILDTSVLK